MKALVIAAVAVFVVGFLLGWALHGMWLGAEYQSLSNLMRPEEEAMGLMGWMSLGYAVWAFGVAWLYSKGRENRPWLGQGVRFGIGLAAVTAVPYNLSMYAVQPWPLNTILKAMVADIAIAVVVSVVAALVFDKMGAARGAAA